MVTKNLVMGSRHFWRDVEQYYLDKLFEEVIVRLDCEYGKLRKLAGKKQCQ
jgi:hypothetical protein